MCTYQWRRVSIEDVDVYLPWNVPIMVPRRWIVFGEAESQVEVIVPKVESGDEVIVPNVEGERVGDGDGR